MLSGIQTRKTSICVFMPRIGVFNLECSKLQFKVSTFGIDFVGVTGRNCAYTVLPTTGVPDRDILFTLYNDIGMFETKGKIHGRNYLTWELNSILSKTSLRYQFLTNISNNTTN